MSNYFSPLPRPIPGRHKRAWYTGYVGFNLLGVSKAKPIREILYTGTHTVRVYDAIYVIINEEIHTSSSFLNYHHPTRAHPRPVCVIIVIARLRNYYGRIINNNYYIIS